MIVTGYKAFNQDMTNRYGIKFSSNEIYHIDGELKFGNHGNGFHFCTNFVDVFRYFNSKDIAVAKVYGFGKLLSYNDEYNGYYDMYVSEYLKVSNVFTRKQIIDKVLNENNYNVIRFLQTFKLNEEEIKKFAYEFNNISVLKTLMYYQLNYKDIFFEKNDNKIYKINKKIID